MSVHPTRVGNTFVLVIPGVTGTVHPHPRGEYPIAIACALNLFGSSPPAWGIRPADLSPPGRGRFIPTRVGNTMGALSAVFKGTVHPHPRGEYYLFEIGNKPARGSSPPAWGILYEFVNHHSQLRFIPPAWEYSRGSTRSSHDSVHPHPRGEYDMANAENKKRAGSSPPAWGILVLRPGGGQRQRFIPTRVGNTPSAHKETWRRTFIPHPRGEYALSPSLPSEPVVHPHPRGEYFVIA